MKRRGKALLAMCLTLSMAAGMLSACGGPKAADDSAAKETAAEETVAKASDNDEEVVVKIFHHFGEQDGRDALDKIIARVEEENPGIKYEVQGLDYSQYGSMLKTKIAGGDAPDIIMGRPKVYADLISAGHVMDLSDEAFVSGMSEDLLSSMKIDGNVYGIPMSLAGMGVFYNREVFEANGLEVPKSHADLMAAADTFVDAGIVAFAHGFQEGWTAQCDIQSDLYGYTLQQNPKMFEEIQSGAKSFADYPDFKDCLTRNADRLAYEGGDDFGTDVAKARAMLINGEAAMFIGGNWDISEFINAGVDDKIGFFATPNTSDDEPVLGLAPDGSFMIYSQTEHKAEALKFLEFWASEEAFEIWNVSGSNIPVNLDVDTTDMSPLVVDIINIAKHGKVYNYETEEVFSGQFDASFRAWQEEFSADPDRNVDTYIQKLDDELAAIK